MAGQAQACATQVSRPAQPDIAAHPAPDQSGDGHQPEQKDDRQPSEKDGHDSGTALLLRMMVVHPVDLGLPCSWTIRMPATPARAGTLPENSIDGQPRRLRHHDERSARTDRSRYPPCGLEASTKKQGSFLPCCS